MLMLYNSYCAVLENIHTPPTERIEISLGGVHKAKKFKEMYEA